MVSVMSCTVLLLRGGLRVSGIGGEEGWLTGLGGLVCEWRTWACTVFLGYGVVLPRGLAGVGESCVIGEMAGVLCVCSGIVEQVGVLCVYVGVVHECVSVCVLAVWV